MLEDDVFCGPSMVFTNVDQPAQPRVAEGRVPADAGAARRDPRRQLDHRLRPHDRRVRVHRRRRGRHEGRARLRAGGRQPGASCRLGVRVRREAGRRQADRGPVGLHRLWSGYTTLRRTAHRGATADEARRIQDGGARDRLAGGRHRGRNRRQRLLAREGPPLYSCESAYRRARQHVHRRHHELRAPAAVMSIRCIRIRTWPSSTTAIRRAGMPGNQQHRAVRAGLSLRSAR